MSSLKSLAGAVVATSMLLAVAKADRPPANAKPVADIIEQLEKADYSPIEFSFDDGTWEVDVYKQDQPYELAVDPQSGKILSEHRDSGDPRPPKDAQPLSKILRGLAKADYSQFSEASFEHSRWEIEAMHDGSKREIHIDPVTGEVTSDRRDD